MTLDSDPLLVAMHDALRELATTANPAIRAADVSSPCGSTCGGIVGRVVAFTLIALALGSTILLLSLGRGLKRRLDWSSHRDRTPPLP